MNKFTEYKIKCKKGIDDLQNEYAFTHDSTGVHEYTNEISQYLESNGWLGYRFDDIDITDQEAIYKESERRKQANLDYIETLYNDGIYGEEYEITISIQDNSAFDTPFSSEELPLSSYSFVIFDTNSKESNIKIIK